MEQADPRPHQEGRWDMTDVQTAQVIILLLLATILGVLALLVHE
jgi:hypothetical protein